MNHKIRAFVDDFAKTLSILSVFGAPEVMGSSRSALEHPLWRKVSTHVVLANSVDETGELIFVR